MHLRFAIDANTTFNGRVILNGTNFVGTFSHNCEQTSGACIGEITNRSFRTGNHQVCVSAISTNGQYSEACQSVLVVGQQGKLELYVDGDGAPLNDETVLRTRPLSGDYDPRLTYSLDFGDGSAAVRGSQLNEHVQFKHVYRSEASYIATMTFSDGTQLTCNVRVANKIETFEVELVGPNVVEVGSSINLKVHVVCAGEFFLLLNGETPVKTSEFQIGNFQIVLVKLKPMRFFFQYRT